MNWWRAFEAALGIGVEPGDLTFGHIALRGLIVFVLAIVIVRLGDKRFIARKTAFDVILAFMLGSMLARAVNGSAPFWATLGGGFVLVGLHRIIAFASRRWHGFGKLVKGDADLLIRDGCVLEDAMRRNDLSEHDLAEDLRLKGVEKPEQVKLAYVERSGDLGVVKKEG